MASNSNNLSKQGIQDVYRTLITKFDNEGKDVSVLRNRLSKLTLRDKKKDRLILAEELLRNVIKMLRISKMSTECPLIYIIQLRNF